jgi:uncharacterized Fe-S radical SAM superfamily protein PflX
MKKYKYELDGLTKTERYRLKDIDEYRAKKAAYARTEQERKKRREYMRIWREKNREYSNELARASHQRNKHKHVDKKIEYALRKSFGIGIAEKAVMVSNQNGVCKICSEPFKNSRSTHVDHCHKTGKIRGILCHVCNTKLGWFEKYREAVMQYADTVW